MPEPPFIVKVCGVTNREDAQAALDAGANALGFNFYSKSPRFLSFVAASEIISALRGQYLRVGVFVHPTGEELTRSEGFLDVAQIHGAGKSNKTKIWRAISAGTIPEPDPSVAAWLLDSFTPAYGGSGKTFDWSIAAKFPHRVIAAGGLDAGNVAEAISIASPWGVDSCSRLESSPGRKDHARVAAFVQNALAAFHSKQVVKV